MKDFPTSNNRTLGNLFYVSNASKRMKDMIIEKEREGEGAQSTMSGDLRREGRGTESEKYE